VSDQLLKIGGEALNGCYYSNHFAVDQPSDALQKFLTAPAAAPVIKKHGLERAARAPSAI